METLGGIKGIQRGLLRVSNGWKRMGAATLFLLQAPVFAPSAPAAEVVFAGICPDMTLELTFTPARTTLPAGTTTVHVDGSGACLLQDGQEYPGTLTGTATTLPMAEHVTCQGGALAGSGSFDVTFVGFPAMTGPMAVVLAGGVASISLVSTDVSSVGTGEGSFTQAPEQTLQCPQSETGPETTTWQGSFAFECRGNLVQSSPRVGTDAG